MGGAHGAVRRIHEHFGQTLSDEAERQIRAWHRENPQGRHGGHRYSAAAFGLDEEAIAERFAKYMQHFDVTRERG